MRTAEEVLEEFGNSFTAEIAYQEMDLVVLKENAIDAMKAYAREALEEAAKQAKTKEQYEGEGRDSFYAGTVVDKESITGIELK